MFEEVEAYSAPPPAGREIRRLLVQLPSRDLHPRYGGQPHSPLSGLWLSGPLTPHLHHNFAGIARGCAAKLDDRSDVRLTRTAACNQFVRLYTSGQCNEGSGFSTGQSPKSNTMPPQPQLVHVENKCKT